MNRKVQKLSRDEAFHTGDQEAYSTARLTLKTGIREVLLQRQNEWDLKMARETMDQKDKGWRQIREDSETDVYFRAVPRDANKHNGIIIRKWSMATAWLCCKDLCVCVFSQIVSGIWNTRWNYNQVGFCLRLLLTYLVKWSSLSRTFCSLWPHTHHTQRWWLIWMCVLAA